MRNSFVAALMLTAATQAAAAISPADEDKYDRLKIAEELSYSCGGASYFEQFWMQQVAAESRTGSRAKKYVDQSRGPGLGAWVDPKRQEENEQYWRQRAVQLGCDEGKKYLDDARAQGYLEAAAIALLAMSADQQQPSMPTARKMSDEEKMLVQLVVGTVQQQFGPQAGTLEKAALARFQEIAKGLEANLLSLPAMLELRTNLLYDSGGLELAAQSAGYAVRIERLDDKTALPVLRPKTGSAPVLTVLGGPANMPVTLRMPAGSVVKTRAFVAVDDKRQLWTVTYGAQAARVAGGRVTGAIVGWHTPSYGEGITAQAGSCPWAMCVIHTPEQVKAMADQTVDGSLYSVMTGLDSYGTGSDKRADRVVFSTGNLRAALAPKR